MLAATAQPSWQATLALQFAVQGDKTALIHNAHSGPLRVQKALYPEGKSVCHAVMLHPPAGIAGGDTLDIEVCLQPASHAVLTTPGASQWYKSQANHPASLTAHLTLHAQSKLDWLPQENILFNASHARLSTTLDIDPSASAIGWDVCVLGRAASAEIWENASLHQSTRLIRGGVDLWLEASQLVSNDALSSNLAALSKHRVMATVWALGVAASCDMAQTYAEQLPYSSELKAGITFLQDRQYPGGAIILRILGDDMALVRQCITDAWLYFRPLIHVAPAAPLRLWAL